MGNPEIYQPWNDEIKDFQIEGFGYLRAYLFQGFLILSDIFRSLKFWKFREMTKNLKMIPSS